MAPERSTEALASSGGPSYGGSMDVPPPVPGDTRDWTFVLQDGCNECGWQVFSPRETPARLSRGALRWEAALQRPHVHARPARTVWSPLEYACHVRDMVRLLTTRVHAMVSHDDPRLANWDGDAKAVELRYWDEDPYRVAIEIEAATRAAVAALTPLTEDDWQRTGHRSDGVEFTVASMCLYIDHEMEHHLHDVRA